MQCTDSHRGIGNPSKTWLVRIHAFSLRELVGHKEGFAVPNAIECDAACVRERRLVLGWLEICYIRLH